MPANQATVTKFETRMDTLKRLTDAFPNFVGPARDEAAEKMKALCKKIPNHDDPRNLRGYAALLAWDCPV